jgi:hypothetical protein
MKMNRRRSLTVAALAVIVLSGATRAAEARPFQRRISLNPYGAYLDGGASLLPSGYDGPIRLPGNGGAPAFGFGFTVPEEYVPDTDLIVEILWETPETDCTFHLSPTFLFRAGPGEPRDFGGASSGLHAVDASTPFVLLFQEIVFEAPAKAHETAKVRFRISPTPGEFRPFVAGDAVNFAIFREDWDADDTCGKGDLGIAGASILYEAQY